MSLPTATSATRKPAACEDRLQFQHVPAAKKDINRKNVTRCRAAEEQKYGNKVKDDIA